MSKQLLIDVIPFEFSKEIINESVNAGGPLIVTAVLQRIGIKNYNGRVYTETVLRREAQLYAEAFVKERRAVGEIDHPNCVHSCKIMTNDGWKHIKDISESELIYTLNINTNEIELQNITKKIDQPYKGKMFHIKGRNIDIIVTPNHRFLVNDRNNIPKFVTASEIYDLSKSLKVAHLTIPKTGKWVETVNFEENFVLPSVKIKGKPDNISKQSNNLILNTKAFFAFLGFYLAEGWVSSQENGRGYRISISQNEGEISEKFREILKNLSPDLKWSEIKNKKGNIQFYTHDARLWTYLKQLGNKYTKFIPNDIKNASVGLLEELFEWFLNGDGTIINDRGYDRTSVFSVSKKLVEDLQEVLFKIGGSGRIKLQESSKDYMYADHLIEIKNKIPLHRLWVDKSSAIHIDFRFLKIEEIDFDDRVYCVEVPNQTFYCENASKCFWSGNSSVVNLKNVSHNIIEMHWEGNNLVGKIEILTTPSGNILKELLKCGVKLGISSRGLGTVKEIAENTDEVQDDYQLICFDIVSNPSTKGAFIFPENLNESTSLSVENDNSNTNKWRKVEDIIRDVLGEINPQ